MLTGSQGFKFKINLPGKREANKKIKGDNNER